MLLPDIPTIDISPLANGGPDERTSCGRAMGDALRGVGFFQVTGHGVEPGMLERVYDSAQGFFGLPTTEKMTVAMRRETGYRGYFPLLGEVTDPAFGGDPKEGFDVALR